MGVLIGTEENVVTSSQVVKENKSNGC